MNRLNTEESNIPYEYHHFDFCVGDETNSPVENLGQVVFGERIRPGPYKIEFLKDVECQAVSRTTVKLAIRSTCKVNSDREVLDNNNNKYEYEWLYYEYEWVSYGYEWGSYEYEKIS